MIIMKTNRFGFVLILCFFVSFAVHAQSNELRVFAKDRNALTVNKKKLKSGNMDLLPAYAELLKKSWF